MGKGSNDSENVPLQLKGNWSGTMPGTNADQLAVELSISDGSGGFKMRPQTGQGRNNPCLGREFPVAVTSREASSLL